MASSYYFLCLHKENFMTSPMTQLRRAGRAHELNHRRKLKEDTPADDETAHVAQDVGPFVGQ